MINRHQQSYANNLTGRYRKIKAILDNLDNNGA
jgi:hypothetical protein